MRLLAIEKIKHRGAVPGEARVGVQSHSVSELFVLIDGRVDHRRVQLDCV